MNLLEQPDHPLWSSFERTWRGHGRILYRPPDGRLEPVVWMRRVSEFLMRNAPEVRGPLEAFGGPLWGQVEAKVASWSSLTEQPPCVRWGLCAILGYVGIPESKLVVATIESTLVPPQDTPETIHLVVRYLAIIVGEQQSWGQGFLVLETPWFGGRYLGLDADEEEKPRLVLEEAGGDPDAEPTELM